MIDRSNPPDVAAGMVVETTFCAEHLDLATALRCNRCGNLMCTKCAQRTPVGIAVGSAYVASRLCLELYCGAITW